MLTVSHLVGQAPAISHRFAFIKSGTNNVAQVCLHHITYHTVFRVMLDLLLHLISDRHRMIDVGALITLSSLVSQATAMSRMFAFITQVFRVMLDFLLHVISDRR